MYLKELVICGPQRTPILVQHAGDGNHVDRFQGESGLQIERHRQDRDTRPIDRMVVGPGMLCQD